jgi:hypothetical protein
VEAALVSVSTVIRARQRLLAERFDEVAFRIEAGEATELDLAPIIDEMEWLCAIAHAPPAGFAAS